MNKTELRKYAHPEALVSTEWVDQHLKDPNVRIVESNEDPLLYVSEHIPGAVEVDWVRDLNDPIRRDYLDREAFQKLVERLGITPEMTVVFYGDKGNWWAAYAFWLFKLFGHKDARLMDGGRRKWQEEERPLTKAIPHYPPTTYNPPERNDKEDRVFREEVLTHTHNKGKLIDVRTPAEFTGLRLHMEGYPNEGALRGGHIPGAKNIPWARAIEEEDGSFKEAEDLERVYQKEFGFMPEDNIIVYCRIGERSSHTWFVLKYLLGYPNVKNYDGSWTEWGNLVGVPIEKP